MTMLDYAAAFEALNHRRRRIRRALLGLSAVIVAALPALYLGLSGLG